nr:tumor necrosis factor receptor superfamily member 16 isoform X4 [Crassostrea gigas]
MAICMYYPNLSKCRNNKFGSNDGSTSSKCSKNTTYCPPGHYYEVCDQDRGARCVQCDSKSYQPDNNGPLDKCKTRTQCNRRHMQYADVGSTIRDASCRCNPGFHFRKGDNSLCMPNRVCPVGYGQADYGNCEDCHKRNAYSDRADTVQRCLPLKNCEKENRCTKRRSNGTFNNECDVPTKDISNCTDPRSTPDSQRSLQSAVAAPVYAGAAVGAIIFLVLLFFLVMFLLWKRRRAQSKEDALSRDQIESLLERIVTRSEGDEPYSRKVIAASFREIEDRIDRQIWKLPQELFRDHMQPAMYEVIVEKYKEKDHKYAINGYLQDWREWKGENSEAIAHLFKCLRLVEREDIVYEICNKFREGYPEVVMDAEVKLDNGIVKKRSHQITFEEYLKETLCCCSSKRKRYTEKGEPAETQDSLLSPQEVKAREAEVTDKERLNEPDDVPPLSPSEAGAIYRERPSPSAPVIDDVGNVHVIIPMNRAYSFPVQASS